MADDLGGVAGERPGDSEQPTLDAAEAPTRLEDDASPDVLASIRAAHGHDIDPGIDLRTPGGTGAPADVEGRRASGTRYEIGHEIARGGMGAILRVRDRDLRRTLAMKVLRGQASGSGSGRPAKPVPAHLLHRFLEEAQITAQLAHPGVVPVHELGVDADGRVFFTMRLVRGKTLSAVFHLARDEREGWNRTRALQTLLRVCETMAFAHSRGVVHRDLKPQNVMVGDYGAVYVMDWGLAKVRDHDDGHDIRVREPDAERIATQRSETPDSPLLTMDGAVIGTPAYMPPEQAEGRVDELDAASDVYAIGAMLYQLLASRPPYVGPDESPAPLELLRRLRSGPAQSIGEIDPSIAPELEAITAKAMAREKRERYETADALGDELQRFLSGHVVRAYRTGALVELRKWVERNRAVAATAAAALLLVTGLSAFYSISVTGERDRAWNAEQRALQREREKGEALDAARVAQADAERERDAKDAALTRARSLGLASASEASLTADPQLALLLALRGVEAQPIAEAVTRLRRAVGATLLRGSFEAKGGTVNELAFAPDGKWILVAHNGGPPSLLDRDGRLVRQFEGGRRDSYHRIVCSPDGRHVAAGAPQDQVHVFGIDGTRRASIALELGGDRFGPRVVELAFTPDGASLLVVQDDPAGARFYSLDGELQAELDVGEHEIEYAELSRNGESVLTLSDAPTPLARISRRDGTTVASFAAPFGRAVLAPDGRRLVVTQSFKPARVLGSDGSLAHELRQPGTALLAAYSPDGRHVAVGGTDARVRVFDDEGLLLATMVGHARSVDTIAFSPDGSRLLTAASDGAARLWEANGDLVAALRKPGHRADEAFFSPAGDRVATTHGTEVCVWDTEPEEAATLRGHEGALVSARFSPAGDRVLTVGRDATVRVWALDGRETARITVHEGGVGGARFSPDGRRIVTFGEERWRRREGSTYRDSPSRSVRVWTTDGQEVVSVVRPEYTPRDVLFEPGGHGLIVVTAKGLRFLDSDGEESATKGPASSSAGSISFSPDGERVLVWGRDGARVVSRDGLLLAKLGAGRVISASFAPVGGAMLTVSGRHVQFWDRDGFRAGRTTGHTDDVTSACFSPDGELVLTTSEDRTARLWDADAREVAVLAGHGATVQVGCFVPPGDKVLTGSADGTARLWDREGRELAVLSGHGGGVRGVDAAPAGDLVLTASDDGTARIWVADTKALRRLARERLVRDFSDEERTRFAGLLGE